MLFALVYTFPWWQIVGVLILFIDMNTMMICGIAVFAFGGVLDGIFRERMAQLGYKRAFLKGRDFQLQGISPGPMRKRLASLAGLPYVGLLHMWHRATSCGPPHPTCQPFAAQMKKIAQSENSYR